MSNDLVLASSSASRRMMLESAGVPFTVAVPAVDEDLLKALLSDAGKDGDGIAQELADAKALSVSRHLPNEYVLGADQLLICDGQIYSKADTAQKARDTLEALSGRQHRLISAAVIARDGVTLWRRSDAAMLRMRLLSADFLDQYLSAEIPEILGSVGCYRIEGRGAQLFSEVSGDHFSIRGLPLIPVLGALRDFGVIPI
jgi:nucleoside triphosphate pyrophosphatase